MPRARLFDYDEAKRLRADGLTYQAIADRFGVSNSAVALAVNDAAREIANERANAWQRRGVCIDCGGQCTRTAGTPAHRCKTCAALAKATSVREDELQCMKCREWKPDAGFPSNRAESGVRRGRHDQCRPCLTEAKREWRERTRVPCSYGCGRLVEGKNRRTPGKPPACFYCATSHRRVAALRTRRDTAA